MLSLFDRRAFGRVLVRRFQVEFLISLFSSLVLIGIVFIVAVFGPSTYQLLDNSSSPEEKANASAAFLAFHHQAWTAIAVAVVLAVIRLAILSHRVAGPLVRLTRVFEAVGRGDVSMRVRLRQRDYLTEEAAAADRMTMSLRRRLGSAKARSARLDAALAELRATMADDAPGREALQRVEIEAQRLAARLDSFRTVARRADDVTATTRETKKPGPIRMLGLRADEKGFTLIELLLVLALIGVLAAMAIPAYGEALNRAKVVRAIGEIRAIDTQLKAYDLSHGELPLTLEEAGITGLLDPYGMPYEYLRMAGLKGKGGVRKDHKLNPINFDFDLYSKRRDKVSKAQVTNKDSLDDIIRANDGGFIGVAREF